MKIPEHLWPAYARARRRSFAKKFDISEEEEAKGSEYVIRSHESLPYEITEMVALGRRLAKKYKW